MIADNLKARAGAGATVAGAALLVLGHAQAADLPARSSAPAAEYVAVCHVGEMTGFRIPGSDTCLKISGYVAALAEIGSLKPQYALGFAGAAGDNAVNAAPLSPVGARDAAGISVHGQVDIDARSNTALGPLRSYVELASSNGIGLDSSSDQTYLSLAFVQVGGLTAGRAPSLFSFLGGGLTWYEFYSPDRINSNQPLLLAYSAPLGSGWSATLSFEDPQGTNVNYGVDGGYANAYAGFRLPDIVAALRVEQSWGAAQLSVAAHETRVTGVSGDWVDHWGNAALLGATFNTPGLGAGDRIAAQIVRTAGALGYSGIVNTAQSGWDQGLNMGGNGTIFQLTDALNYAPGAWSYPTTWTAAALLEHHISSQFTIDPEIAFARVDYSGAPAMISARATSEMGGFIVHWTPAPRLDIQFQAMAQGTRQATPAGYVGAAPFVANSFGIVGAVEIVREF